jgi:aminomethyltransferase
MADAEPLKKLPLDALWRARTSKFGAFAGYDMPLQFEGLIPEHNWTRAHAGLFDVSHMGPCFLSLTERPNEPQAAHEAVAALIEKIVPADIKGLKPGQVRYTMITNEDGGVLDDLMIARPVDDRNQGMLHIVVNASMKEQDFALIEQAAASQASLRPAEEHSLLALQGPSAIAVMAGLVPEIETVGFMSLINGNSPWGPIWMTRSGYTGEDGCEVLVANSFATQFAEELLAHPEVRPIGLGARDSLRLEAGLCLYGHELDPTTSPIEADLAWTIQKRRREAGDFPGAKRIPREYELGVSRKRVGVRPNDRAPARDGVEIFKDGKKIGVVTSGGFSPTLNGPISMGYVDAAHAEPGCVVDLMIRGVPRAATITPLPFVPHRYVRKGKT